MAIKGLDSLRNKMDSLGDEYNTGLRAVFLQGLGNIAIGTPEDEGQARSNWFLKVGSPSTKTTTQKTGDNHLSSMPKNVLGKKIFYANNLPYINKLEYGGYPNPSKTGNKTINGYSDQAIGGWVRRELLIMRAGIKKL